MPAPTILIEDHHEDTHSLNSSSYNDPQVLVSGLSASANDFFIFFGITEKGASGTQFGWRTVDSNGFSQSPGNPGHVIESFGPGSANFLSQRSEFATLDSDIASGTTANIHFNQEAGKNVLKRVYLGLKWNVGLLDQPYPNTPTGYSDIISFDAYNNTEGTSTAPSIIMPAGYRYWTRTPGAGDQGRPGMLMGWVAWDASGGASFSASSPWIEAVTYKPTTTYGIAIYYQYFDANDADYTFSGTLSSSTEWQAEIVAYKALEASHLSLDGIIFKPRKSG